MPQRPPEFDTCNGYALKEVLSHFDADIFDCFGTAQRLAMQQLKTLGLTNLGTVLDVGCGTGNMLVALREYFAFNAPYGLDLSIDMLALANKKLADLQVICASASDLKQYFEQSSIDVLLVHFLFAYEPYAQLLTQAASVMKPGGLISIATTTANSFQLAHKATAHWLFKVVNYCFGLDCQAICDRYSAWMPANAEMLSQIVQSCGFEVLVLDRQTITISVATWREAWDFLHNASWFVDAFQRYKITKWVVASAFYLMKCIQALTGAAGPLCDTVEIVVLTARKR